MIFVPLLAAVAAVPISLRVQTYTHTGEHYYLFHNIYTQQKFTSPLRFLYVGLLLVNRLQNASMFARERPVLGIALSLSMLSAVVCELA